MNDHDHWWLLGIGFSQKIMVIHFDKPLDSWVQHWLDLWQAPQSPTFAAPERRGCHPKDRLSVPQMLRPMQHDAAAISWELHAAQWLLPGEAVWSAVPLMYHPWKHQPTQMGPSKVQIRNFPGLFIDVFCELMTCFLFLEWQSYEHWCCWLLKVEFWRWQNSPHHFQHSKFPRKHGLPQPWQPASSLSLQKASFNPPWLYALYCEKSPMTQNIPKPKEPTKFINYSRRNKYPQISQATARSSQLLVTALKCGCHVSSPAR